MVERGFSYMVWNEKGKGWGARAAWHDENGRLRRKSKTWFRTKREAVEWEQQYLSDHADRAPEADTMTVRQLLEAYITSCKLRGRASNTIRGYTHCADRLNRYLGNKPIDKLNRIMLETVYAQMIAQAVDNGKPIRAGTIAYSHRVLKAACNYAIECKLLKANPCSKVMLPKDDEPFVPSILGAEQAHSVLTVLPQHDGQLYLVVLLCVVYGLRRGEALGLRWSDIDFKNETITIAGQYTYDGNGQPIWKPRLKTSQSHRTLYLVPYIKEELLAVRAAFPKDRIVQYVCELDGVLPTPNTITKRWENFRAKYGFDKVRVHDLRHSAATMLIKSGADLNTVKNMLGHTKIETTERYLHTDFETAAAAAQKVVAGIFPETKNEQKEKSSGS